METKTILIIGCLLFIVLSGKCSLNDLTDSVSMAANARDNIRESMQVDPNATMDQECLNAAKDELKPYWSAMSRVSRATMAYRIVTVCAGEGR